MSEDKKWPWEVYQEETKDYNKHPDNYKDAVWWKNSKPIKKNINLINSLFNKGYHIKIFTARYMGRTNDNRRLAQLKAKNLTISQLKKWKVKYNSIYFGKISYDMIVDDKAIFFKKNWTKHLKHLE